ncbi:MAG: cytochrome c [Chitinophagaceae bacterium]|nr:cytochrome c [Chitinophagaceae bacterium]
MKKFWIISIGATMMVGMLSCNKVRRSPGRVYMPDMAYSRALETYSSTEGLQKEGVNYTAMPVTGTIARGDMAAYELKNDSAGYADSKNIINPLPLLDAKKFIEAARLYLVNCGICHGTKLDGNGPLWNGGKGPFPAAPRNLLTDPVVVNMAEGTMFHSVTYGRNTMGAYASQLSTEQRWMIIHYIKEKQASIVAAPAAVADSAAAKKPK